MLACRLLNSQWILIKCLVMTSHRMTTTSDLTSIGGSKRPSRATGPCSCASTYLVRLHRRCAANVHGATLIRPEKHPDIDRRRSSRCVSVALSEHAHLPQSRAGCGCCQKVQPIWKRVVRALTESGVRDPAPADPAPHLPCCSPGTPRRHHPRARVLSCAPRRRLPTASSSPR
jgi:hypothetical protein